MWLIIIIMDTTCMQKSHDDNGIIYDGHNQSI